MDDTTWALVEAERVSLADLLDTLGPDEWEASSLCAEWRVRDVAAHLAMTPAGAPSLGTMLKALAANRGRLWAAGRDVTIAYARRPTGQLVAELRRDAALCTKPVFVSADNILLDLVVHGQDIAVPLGITRSVPAPAGQSSLSRLWAMGWPFHARRRWGDVTLQADDCDWSAGRGPVVNGTAAQLLLLMTARAGSVDRLQGPGLELVRRLATPRGHQPDITAHQEQQR